MSRIKYLHIHNGGDSVSRTAEVGGTIYVGLQLQGWQVESKIIESNVAGLVIRLPARGEKVNVLHPALDPCLQRGAGLLGE